MFRKKKEADFINYNSQSYSFNSDKDKSSQKQLSKIHEKLKSSDKSNTYKNNSFKQSSQLSTSKLSDKKPVSNLLQKARNQAILNSKLQPSKTEHNTLNIKSTTTRNQLNKFSQKKRDATTSGGLFENKVQMDLLKTHFKNLPNKPNSSISNRLSHKIMNLNENKLKERRSKNNSIIDDKTQKKTKDHKNEGEIQEIPEIEIKTIDNINELMDRETNSTNTPKSQLQDSDNKYDKQIDTNLQQNDTSNNKPTEEKKHLKVPLFKGSNSLKPSYKTDKKITTSNFEVNADIKKSSGSGSKGSKKESPKTNMINIHRPSTDRFHNKVSSNLSSINFNSKLNTKFISTDKNLKEVNREYQMRGVKGLSSQNSLFSSSTNKQSSLYQKMKSNIISGAQNNSKSKSNGSSSNLYGFQNNRSHNKESGLSSGHASNKRSAIKKIFVKTNKEGEVQFIKEGEKVDNKTPEGENKNSSENDKNSDQLDLKPIIEQKPIKPSQSVNVVRERTDTVIRETKYSSQNIVNQIQGMITTAKTVKRTKPGEYNREEPKKYVRTRVVTAVNSQLESSSRMSRVGTSSMSSKAKLTDKRQNSRKAQSYQR